MGLEYMPQNVEKEKKQAAPVASTAIPGLDFSVSDAPDDDFIERKKVSHLQSVPLVNEI